uniref:Uncharacterized protein n=1 Tax=Craspedostauros australis TaxID=1486917 RepID=A0A7R9WTM3_9STRA
MVAYVFENGEGQSQNASSIDAAYCCERNGSCLKGFGQQMNVGSNHGGSDQSFISSFNIVECLSCECCGFVVSQRGIVLELLLLLWLLNAIPSHLLPLPVLLVIPLLPQVTVINRDTRVVVGTQADWISV